MTIEEIEKSDLKAGTFGVFTSNKKVKSRRIDNKKTKFIEREYYTKEYGFYGGLISKENKNSIIRITANDFNEYYPDYDYRWIEFTPLTEIPICEVGL